MDAPTNPGFPDGWFGIALSSEVPSGGVLATRLAGRELVVFRTASGKLSVLDAFCPHLGAHLGHAGKVEGEQIQCRFHGFCFDASGACVATGYGTKPPPRAVIPAVSWVEQDGVILAWRHHAGAPPDWQPPVLDPDGFSPFLWSTDHFRGHPQEVAENSVDVGHFAHVHGYKGFEVLQPGRTDGPLLTAGYRFYRTADVIGRPDKQFHAEIAVRVHGVGFSHVEGTDHTTGLRFRFVLLGTATDVNEVTYRSGVAVCADGLRSRSVLYRVLPRAVDTHVLRRVVALGLARDLAQDIPFWKHKRYAPRPALAAGDGPIGLYRKWVRQFYPGGTERLTESQGSSAEAD